MWTNINESIVTETSYTVLNLDLGVAYQFCISAVTTENEESPKTRPISFTLKVPDDQTPPTVAGSIPAGNAREVTVDSSITVLFSEDLLVGPNYGEVSLLVDGKLIGFVISLSKNALTIMPNEDLPYSSVCKLTIPSGAVLDYGGNSLQKAFITTFTTEGPPDTTSPEIIASAPAADETGVSIDRNVIIVLSELVIEGETFTGIQLMKGESVVETTIEIEESLLIITPKQPLDYETIYRVFIPEGAVEDTAFNPLESDHSFSFITRLAPDLGPPVVTATTPSNNETEVSLMPVITIYFSELIEEELMVSPSLNCNGRPVEIVVKVGEVIVEGTPDEPAVVDYSMLIITPVEQLDEDSVCQVTILAGAVCDNAGNSLTDAYSFSFTTVRGADTTPPTVLSMEPANLAQLVPITSSITIHFSEKIEQADECASIKLLVNGEQVPVTLSLQNQVLTLTPDNVLPYSAVCEVVIPAGSVADLSSNACPGWSGTFTTEEAPDTIPPDLIKTSPADNSKIGVEQRNFIFCHLSPPFASVFINRSDLASSVLPAIIKPLSRVSCTE
jgi:methionine-rich copper-binding protein CopC